MVGLQSGQMQRTVNPSTFVFDGSNPSPTTNHRTPTSVVFYLCFYNIYFVLGDGLHPFLSEPDRKQVAPARLLKTCHWQLFLTHSPPTTNHSSPNFCGFFMLKPL